MKEGKTRMNTKENLTEVDKDRKMSNETGVEMIQTDGIVMTQPTKEFGGG